MSIPVYHDSYTTSSEVFGRRVGQLISTIKKLFVNEPAITGVFFFLLTLVDRGGAGRAYNWHSFTDAHQSVNWVFVCVGTFGP